MPRALTIFFPDGNTEHWFTEVVFELGGTLHRRGSPARLPLAVLVVCWQDDATERASTRPEQPNSKPFGKRKPVCEKVRSAPRWRIPEASFVDAAGAMLPFHQPGRRYGRPC